MGKDKYSEVKEIDKTIGDRIREIRKKKNWSQSDFAENISTDQFDFTSSKISKMESGQQPPKIAELDYIANKLKVNIMYFLGKADSANDESTHEYEIASKFVRLERIGKFIPEFQYRPDDISLSIDLNFKAYLSDLKTAYNTNNMQSYILFPYGEFIIFQDDTVNNEIEKELQEDEDFLTEHTLSEKTSSLTDENQEPPIHSQDE